MIKQDFISVPACVLNLSPIEIKTYCALRLSAERPQLDIFNIADAVNIENSVLRLSILTLRLQGFLLVNSALPARLLLDDLENVPIQLIDRQMSIDEVINADLDFVDFVQTCINDIQSIRQWSQEDGETIALVYNLRRLGKILLIICFYQLMHET